MTASEETPRKRRPVMSDVARLAGVSHQTVSRVINDSRHVRAETRERVEIAMRQLNYRPNSVARALVTGRSKTLGVVSFDTTLYGPASTLYGIERAAHEAGYFITIASLEALDRPSVLDAIERLRVQGVDGILVIAPQEGGARALMQAPAGVPLVALEAGPRDVVPLASVDQVAGAQLATEHLLGLGHATVWHIAGPAGWPEAEDRVRGWRGALEAAGAAVPPPLPGDWSARAGYELTQGLLGEPEVTALFVANDQMALGALRALHEAGRRVPRDVSVVGFDDIPEAPYLLPPLTTVRQDFAELGRHSLALLVEQISTGARRGEQLRFAPSLIVRGSTTAVR